MSDGSNNAVGETFHSANGSSYFQQVYVLTMNLSECPCYYVEGSNDLLTKVPARMKTPLRILHLEDDPFDADLVESIFQEEGIVTEIVRVETRDEFISAIKRGGFDIVFSDHLLPGFDGISALAIEKDNCPDMPFVFITGKMGEELLN